MEVQFFEMTSVGGSEDLYRFKATINNWLAKEGKRAEIINIQQSLVQKAGALSCIVSIWYEPKGADAADSGENSDSDEAAKRSVTTL